MSEASEASDEALAEWLQERVKRFVPGRTGYDWDDRFALGEIVARLHSRAAARLQAYERCAKVAEGFAADLADGLGDPEPALEIAAAIRALLEGE